MITTADLDRRSRHISLTERITLVIIIVMYYHQQVMNTDFHTLSSNSNFRSFSVQFFFLRSSLYPVLLLRRCGGRKILQMKRKKNSEKNPKQFQAETRITSVVVFPCICWIKIVEQKKLFWIWENSRHKFYFGTDVTFFVRNPHPTHI